MGYLAEHPDELCVGDMVDGKYVKRKPTQAEIDNELANEPTAEKQAADRVSKLEKEITDLANEKVDGHIDPAEKAHWMGVADAFTRQHNLWLEEFIVADIEERMPDEITYPPLLPAEKQIWSNLAVIQKLTAAIRDAAATIMQEIYMMTTEQINALSDNWISTHILWP